MGSVHHEQVSDGKNCHEWFDVVLSNTDSIEGLIMHRSTLDNFYHAKIFETQDYMVSNGVYDFVEIISLIYIDLEKLISRTKLSEKQSYIINKLMFGYNFDDIAEINKWDVRSVKSFFKSACKSIKQRYDFEYEEFLEVSGTIKIEDGVKYKTCSKCGEQLRMGNFRPRSDKKGDGFRPECRKCESGAKNLAK